MVSPNLIKRVEDSKPAELNENAKKLFQVIYSEQNKKEAVDDDQPKIKVSSLVSRLAFFYEKARNVVEYEEDHLLRKNAIARILHRQIVIEGVLKESDDTAIATHLLEELIRGNYLPNNSLPETKIKDIAIVLRKYILLKDELAGILKASFGLNSDINKAKELVLEKNHLIKWLLTMAACEIEEDLAPDKVKAALVGNLYEILKRNIQLPNDLPYENDLEIQTYLSIGRTFSKLDEDMLGYILFKYYNGDWQDLRGKEVLTETDQQVIKNLAKRLEKLDETVKFQLEHPLKKQLDKVSRVYSLYFSILEETISEDPAKVYSELSQDGKLFFNRIKKVCARRYKKAKSKLWRRAIRSIIYIFFTKSIFVFAIELPAVHWFGEAVNWVSLAINISFPAVLLFVIVALTKTPNERNTEKIMNGIKEIAIAGQEKKQPLVLRRPGKRNPVVSFIFNVIYSLSFAFSVYCIIRLLDFANFNWVSVIIFLFFLAFVSFFSIVVTKSVKELMIIERRDSLLSFLVDLFYMPIILAGKWLSSSFSKINVFIFIFDFILEAPIKILINVAEDWTKYVRERRDSME